MTISPQNPYPESGRNVFESVVAPSIVGNKGPLRFQEGIGTDTDVPNDFQRGAFADPAPGRPRLATPDAESVFKRADETMRERAHVGSASWISAPQVLSDFVQGAVSGDGPAAQFEHAYNSGAHQARPNPTVVSG